MLSHSILSCWCFHTEIQLSEANKMITSPVSHCSTFPRENISIFIFLLEKLSSKVTKLRQDVKLQFFAEIFIFFWLLILLFYFLLRHLNLDINCVMEAMIFAKLCAPCVGPPYSTYKLSFEDPVVTMTKNIKKKFLFIPISNHFSKKRVI